MGRMSGRMIGRELGCMTAQEVNMLLCEEGFLEGEPGDYTVTEKGEPYAEERDYHRGTGGYATYNRYWTTRSWEGYRSLIVFRARLMGAKNTCEVMPRDQLMCTCAGQKDWSFARNDWRLDNDTRLRFIRVITMGGLPTIWCIDARVPALPRKCKPKIQIVD